MGREGTSTYASVALSASTVEEGGGPSSTVEAVSSTGKRASGSSWVCLYIPAQINAQKAYHNQFNPDRKKVNLVILGQSWANHLTQFISTHPHLWQASHVQWNLVRVSTVRQALANCVIDQVTAFQPWSVLMIWLE